MHEESDILSKTSDKIPSGPQNSTKALPALIIFFKDPIYLQSVTIHSANGGKGEGWHVEEYSVALLC
jgi:hypothetical protein